MANANDVMKDLRAARDEARVQIHLMSMDARERWRELESAFESIEQKVNQSGERVTEALLGATANLTQTVKEFVRNHGRLRPALGAPVRSIMSPAPATCSPDDSLNRAAQIMWDINCGAVPVVSANGSVVGIITDRDICMASYTRGEPLSACRVGSAMSSQPLLCFAHDPIDRVFDIMTKHQVRRVVVTDDAGQVSGLVSLADLARWVQTLRVGREPASEALTSTLAAISAPQRAAHASAAE
jgi:CBS domain-containing protein